MANQYTAKIDVNVRGTNLIINKFRSANPEISQAQYKAGEALGVFFTGEAYRIIRTLSPKSKGTLAASITHNTIKSQGGWRTKVYSDLDYAKVVESGGQPEVKQVDSALKDWYKRVTGQNIKIGQYRTVRGGNNPNYNTAIGMRYFQTPFKKNQAKIAEEYQKRVKQALKNVNITYY